MVSHHLKKKLKVCYSSFKYVLIYVRIVFMEEFDANKDGRVTWDEFVEAMGKMKAKVNNKASGAKEY